MLRILLMDATPVPDGRVQNPRDSPPDPSRRWLLREGLTARVTFALDWPQLFCPRRKDTGRGNRGETIDAAPPHGNVWDQQGHLPRGGRERQDRHASEVPRAARLRALRTGRP